MYMPQTEVLGGFSIDQPISQMQLSLSNSGAGEMHWNALKLELLVGFGGFNVGLELRKWAIADGPGFIPKDVP